MRHTKRHCFRRRSATILIDAGSDITSLKHHGEWKSLKKSTPVAESYIDKSIENKVNHIFNSIESNETNNFKHYSININNIDHQYCNKTPNSAADTF
ncbi:hypothetical protein NQ317_008070 [Molorchus minor]|uniref:Peptidase A2 domain-containing protein n=1 Tax=Molorchus minor TaxID=1323400 RepID=A0ABQ9J3S6_9CUCU|nr:hypothetical protein NQ317_008070 [Molorchus minor]